jgi:hypothetical protein
LANDILAQENDGVGDRIDGAPTAKRGAVGEFKNLVSEREVGADLLAEFDGFIVGLL